MSLNNLIDLKSIVVHNLKNNKKKYESKELLFNYDIIQELIIDKNDPTYIINIYIEICYHNTFNIYFKNKDKYKSILLVFLKLYFDFPKTIIALIEELPNFFFLVNLLNLVHCVMNNDIYTTTFSKYVTKIKLLSNKILNIFVFQLNKDYNDFLITKKHKLSYPSISTLILYLTISNTSDIFIDELIIKLFRQKENATSLYKTFKDDLLDCINYLLEKNSNYTIVYDYFDVFTINSVCLTRFYKNFIKEINKYYIEANMYCNCGNKYCNNMNK
jgi:hypothetical protein